jgi:hypothetical protein
MPIHGDETGEQHSALADLVCRLVTEKFGELTNNFTAQTARRKVRLFMNKMNFGIGPTQHCGKFVGSIFLQCCRLTWTGL